MQSPLTTEQITEALAGFADHVPPASLYRFQSPSGFSALSEGKLKITPPREFNDPFEIAPGILTDGLSADDLRQSFLSGTGLVREVFRPRFRTEEDYLGWVERVVIPRSDLWGKHLASLRESVTHATSEVYGITCFSAFSEAVLNGPLGIRHWAIYAKDHTGFVIEYDGEHAMLKSWAASKWLFPVTYHESRPIVGIAEFAAWTQTKSLRVLRHWSEMKCRQAWGEEMEWRLVCPLRPDELNRVEISSMPVDGRVLHFLHLWKSNSPEGQKANTVAIRRVILGARVDAGLEKQIRATLRSTYFRHVKLDRAVLCEKDFALRTEPVVD